MLCWWLEECSILEHRHLEMSLLFVKFWFLFSVLVFFYCGWFIIREVQFSQHYIEITSSIVKFWYFFCFFWLVIRRKFHSQTLHWDLGMILLLDWRVAAAAEGLGYHPQQNSGVGIFLPMQSLYRQLYHQRPAIVVRILILMPALIRMRKFMVAGILWIRRHKTRGSPMVLLGDMGTSLRGDHGMGVIIHTPRSVLLEKHWLGDRV